MRPEHVGDLVDVGQPRLSPDGTSVAFVVTTVDLEENDYRSRIWLAPTDQSAPPRPFTSGEGRDGTPRWSPDGRSLAFVSKRDDKGSGIYVLPVGAGGELVRVASWSDEIDAIEWSPDGTQIAFVARERDEERYGKEKAKDQPARRIERFFARLDTVGWTVDRPAHLFVAPSDGSGRPERVTGGPFEDAGLSWSPDGGSLAFGSGRHDTWDLDLAVDLFTVDSGGGEPVRVTETGESHDKPSWSPGGGEIACIRSEVQTSPRHGQVAVVDVATGATRLLTTDLDRNCAPYISGAREPVWRGEDLVFLVDDGGNVHLYCVPASGAGKPEQVVGGDRQVTGFDVAEGVVAFTATTATALPDLYLLRDGIEERITDFGQRFAARHAVSEPERFVATSADGSEVEGWVIRPVGFDESQQYPALLNIHGGPFTQYGNRLFDEFQVQAGAGYVVIYSNPRGSSGYSEAWGRAIRGPTADVDPGSGWGGVDYEDLMAVTEEAVRRFSFIDADRLGVLGGSYGGYMTTWIAGHTDRFKAGCTERACNNLLSLEYGSDVATAFRTYIGKTHLEDPDTYRTQSPITYVENIRTPLLILHSEDDLRCPIAQAEELFVALRMLGREVEFYRFPGESHELTRSGAPRHRIQRFEIILDFFARHLS